MLPQQRLAHKLIFERISDGYLVGGNMQIINQAMEECGLVWRKGQGYKEMYNAIGYNRNMSKWLEEAAERMDKVVMIDWRQQYRNL